MPINEAMALLRWYNEWRRGADVAMPEPRAVGDAIDAVLSECERLRADLAAAKQDARDAERFVFLIENGARIGWFRGKCKVETAIETLSDWYDDPRTAIDAAILAAKKEGA